MNRALGALSAQANDPSGDPSWPDALASSVAPDALAYVSRLAAPAANRRTSGLSGRPNIGSQLLALEAQGIGRPDSRWIQLEASLRNQNNFNLATDSLFLVARALRNHVSGGVATPLTVIQSDRLGPLDWYSVDSDNGGSTDGVARTLVNRQKPDGSFDSTPDSTAKALLTFFPAATSPVVTNVSSLFSVTHTAWVLNRVSGKYTGNPLPSQIVQWKYGHRPLQRRPARHIGRRHAVERRRHFQWRALRHLSRCPVTDSRRVRHLAAAVHHRAGFGHQL